MRTYTAGQLVTRVRYLTDTENDTNVTDAEILSHLDHNYPRTWGLLADASPPDHMVKSQTFSTVANQLQYNITLTTGSGGVMTTDDFWKLKCVYVVEGSNGELRPLEPINEFNRLWYRAPQGVYSVQMDYLKACPTITSSNTIIDGINGWEEHVVMLTCCDVKMKREEDSKRYYQKAKEIEGEIKRLAKRDAGTPERVVRRKQNDPYFIYRNNLDGYRLRGDYLELYYRSGFRQVP